MGKVKCLLSLTGGMVFMLSLVYTCATAWAQGQPLTFSAYGDIPYGSIDYPILQQHIADHNRYSPSAFLLHIGDMLSGSCIESKYADFANFMRWLAVPAYIVVGDNEYNDCSDPVAALALWKKYFLTFGESFCGAPHTEHQSVRPENIAFTMNGVLFVGINLVGSSVHDQNEWDTRMQQDADWVSQQFQAKISQVRAAVIFAQTGNISTVTPFTTQFRAAAAAFAKPVLYIQGDLHTYKFDQPWPEKNIARLVVPKGNAEPPLEVTINMNTVPAEGMGMYTVKRNPWFESAPFNMPPCVNAGSDQTITSLTASLQGQATDDGEPKGFLTTTWSKLSGPGVVTFGNANALATAASFSAGGTYVLRLMADDGQLQKSDEMTIVAQSGGPTTPPIVSSFSPTNGPVGTQTTIVGSKFTYVTKVAFNGTIATNFTINSDTQILATVPNGATTGKISVANSGGTGVSVDDFIVTAPRQYALTVTTSGSGRVTLNPPGGTYDAGTPVTLTATPAADFRFSGWSGDWTGSTNPATITMDASKNVTATFTPVSGGGQVVHKETQIGSSSGSNLVTTATSLSAVSGHLYLAAISYKSNVGVNSVSGLGLTWTRVKAQCAGRNQTGVEIWMAQGTPSGNNTVTAKLAGTPKSAVIAVSRYSGAAAVNPLGNLISGNTTGANGACSGGSDNAAYSFNLTTTVNGAVIYAVAAMRGYSHTPGVDYTERAEIKSNTDNSDAASVAVQERSVASAATVIVNGSFSGSTDWAMAAVEIKPQIATSNDTVANENAKPPAHFQLALNYPNPFNDRTNVRFGLPRASHLAIKIYSIEGKEVQTVVDGDYPAGTYAITFRTKNLPSGTYFCVMQAGEVRKVRRLMLVK